MGVWEFWLEFGKRAKFIQGGGGDKEVEKGSEVKGNQEEILQAVRRKAIGYTSTESVEELTVQDGQLVLSKQRITTKEVPPDIAAAKLIMEQAVSPFDSLSDEELERERQRLMGELKLKSGENGKTEKGKK